MCLRRTISTPDGNTPFEHLTIACLMKAGNSLVSVVPTIECPRTILSERKGEAMVEFSHHGKRGDFA